MSKDDACLPFSEAEILHEEASEDAIEDEPALSMTIEEPEGVKEVEPDIFIKPGKQPKLKKDGTPRKMPTPDQLVRLAEARKKGLEKRLQNKSARSIDKEIKKQEREEKKSSMEDKIHQDEIIAKLVAERTREIQRGSTFDEDRLSALMEKTIENFMVKKKAEKEKRPQHKIAEAPPPQMVPNPYYAQQMLEQQRHNYSAARPAQPVSRAIRRPKNIEEELFGYMD